MAEVKVINKVKITITKNKAEMSRLAANLILKRIKKRKKLNILVPTGTTPELIYKLLSKQPKNIFSKVNFFNMDEYCIKKGRNYSLIPETDPVSYRYYMNNKLFKKIKPKNYFPDIGNIKNPGSYDKLIKNLGGISLCLDAVGENGHTFGFNSPPAKFSSKTRLVKLTESTRKVNKKLTRRNIPKYAVSTGLRTGMSSKEVIFIACGRRKAKILKKIVYSKPTGKIPATILKNHRNCHWIIDKDAASEL